MWGYREELVRIWYVVIRSTDEVMKGFGLFLFCFVVVIFVITFDVKGGLYI